MKFKNIKINKKVKIFDLLNENEYLGFLIVAIFTSFLIISLFGICFYEIVPEEIKRTIRNIACFIFNCLPFLILLSIALLIIIFLYYAIGDGIKGLLKSRYLPISENEIKELNINNLIEYLEFINSFMQEKRIITKSPFLYLLYLHDKHIDFIRKLAKEEYNEDIIFIRTHYVNDNYFNRFCLFLKDKKIYFAFQNDNIKYSKPSYNIDYEHKIYGDEIIYIK